VHPGASPTVLRSLSADLAQRWRGSEAENFSSSAPSELMNNTPTNWIVAIRNPGGEAANRQQILKLA
jgi:hypothetical protein